MAAKQRKILTELKREQVILQQEELDFISEAVGGCCTGRCQELLEQVGLSSKKKLLVSFHMHYSAFASYIQRRGFCAKVSSL